MTNREMAVVTICAGLVCLTDEKFGVIAQFVHKLLNKYASKHNLMGNTISISIDKRDDSNEC